MMARCRRSIEHEAVCAEGVALELDKYCTRLNALGPRCFRSVVLYTGNPGTIDASRSCAFLLKMSKYDVDGE
jgi:hypothetical protein